VSDQYEREGGGLERGGREPLWRREEVCRCGAHAGLLGEACGEERGERG
jgi:hypothetical protein